LFLLCRSVGALEFVRARVGKHLLELFVGNGLIALAAERIAEDAACRYDGLV